jgi:hypothetical protein
LSGELITRMAQSDDPALVKSTDKFEGICCLLTDLEYSTDVYPTGVPSISAVIRGAKILDIRSGATAWTENNSLIARDWSLYSNGGGLTPTQYDDVACVETANVCDGDSSFTVNMRLPGGGTIPVVIPYKTYRCGIVCSMDGDPTQALDEIIESMAGRRGWAGGKLRVMAGAYRIPVAEITEDWITDASDIKVNKEPPRSELVNTYRVTFADKDNHYIPTPAPPLSPIEYVTADGQEYVREITALGITSSLHAQHIAGCLLRDARESLTIELPCNLRAFKLQLFESVEVTLQRYGWERKVFEIMGWRFSQVGGVILTLKETERTIWQPDAGFADLGYDDNTLLPNPFDVLRLDWITVDSTVDFNDGQIITRTTVTWSPVTQINVLQSGFVEIQYQRLGQEGEVTWVDDAGVPVEWIQTEDIAWTDGANPITWVDGSNTVGWEDGSTTSSVEWTGDIVGDAGSWESIRERADNRSRVITGLRAGFLYLFRARVVTSLGVRSAWTTQVMHKIGSAPLVGTNQLALGAATNVDNINGTAISVTTQSGSPPYAGSRWTTILTSTFTPSYTGVCHVLVTGEFSLTTENAASDGSNWYAVLTTELHSGTRDDSGRTRQVDLLLGQNLNYKGSLVHAREFDVTSGVEVTISFEAQSANVPTTIDRVNMRIEQLKR